MDLQELSALKFQGAELAVLHLILVYRSQVALQVSSQWKCFTAIVKSY
jgi:hypothetical protein